MDNTPNSNCEAFAAASMSKESSTTEYQNPNLIFIPTTSQCSPSTPKRPKLEDTPGSPGLVDLSFLDDIDIDEIVKCLNYSDNTMQISKETGNKDLVQDLLQNNNDTTNKTKTKESEKICKKPKSEKKLCYKDNVISQFSPKKSSNCTTNSWEIANLLSKHINFNNINIKNLNDFEDYNSNENEQSLTNSENTLQFTNSTIQKPNDESIEIVPSIPLESKILVNNLDKKEFKDTIINRKQYPKKNTNNVKTNASEEINQLVKNTTDNLEVNPQSKPLIFNDFTNIKTTSLQNSKNVETNNNITNIQSSSKNSNTCKLHLSATSAKNITDEHVSLNINKKIKEPIKGVISNLPNTLHKIFKNDLIDNDENKTNDLNLGLSNDFKNKISIIANNLPALEDADGNHKKCIPLEYKHKLNTDQCKNESTHNTDNILLKEISQVPYLPKDISEFEDKTRIVSKNNLKVKNEFHNQSQKFTKDNLKEITPLLSTSVKQKHQINKEETFNISNQKNDLKCEKIIAKEKKEKKNLCTTVKKDEIVNKSLNKNKNATNIKKSKEKVLDPPEINISKKKSIDCINSKFYKNKHDIISMDKNIYNNNFPKTSEYDKGDVILSKKLKTLMNKYVNTKYSAFSIIHYGTYSKIFKCNNADEQPFTIKLLRSICERSILKNDKMFNEIQNNIPRENLFCVYILDSFTLDNKFWCYLMEYYPKNLKDALLEKDTPFHIDDVQNLTRQLVTAITSLRCHDIVHSDIKPNHILLDHSNKRLKICGFDDSYYENKVVLLPNIGTGSYRAPEIIMGHSGGFSVDVWSTATVMYEMITGRKLFPGIYNNSLLYKQMSALGNMPYSMINDSMYKDKYFINKTFLRRVGDKGKNIALVYAFAKNNTILWSLYKSYDIHWKDQRNKIQKEKDRLKIESFYKLLEQMLVLHPAYRLTIEFVQANPFLHDISN